MTLPSNLSDVEMPGAFAIYSQEERRLLNPKRIPSHVAIVMDGNRRWAKMRGLPPIAGHWEGAEVLTEILRAASEVGVKALTVYSFSTENWRRPSEEIEGLMQIFEVYLTEKRKMMIEEGVRLFAIGDLERLPCGVQTAFLNTQKATEHCNRIDLVLALNYGGRDDLKRAMVKILNRVQEEKLNLNDLSEDLISQSLDTSFWPDPELIIRTSGEFRLSNFLLWQASYSEFYVTEALWPDFSSKIFLEALLSYQSRERRWGGLC